MAAREHEIGPPNGQLLIKTGRSGLGRRAGHDLVLEAARWTGTATDAGEESAVEVTVEVAGIEVRDGTGGVLPLSDQDRTEIKKNLLKVLQADRHPEIVFRSTAITETEAAGDLTIAGRTEPVTLSVQVDGDQVKGTASVRQTRWGIKPYSAFFGALKLADEVKVEFELTLQ